MVCHIYIGLNEIRGLVSYLQNSVHNCEKKAMKTLN